MANERSERTQAVPVESACLFASVVVRVILMIACHDCNFKGSVIKPAEFLSERSIQLGEELVQLAVCAAPAPGATIPAAAAAACTGFSPSRAA
jgi:hypothetical protein